MPFSFARGLGVVGHRDFWSFRTVHALVGALITVFGASEALFVNDRIRHEIGGLDDQIAQKSERLAAIDRALFQFRFAQTNALVLGVLSANDSLRPEFRINVVQLMFVTRRLPTEMMLAQIYDTDKPAFDRERKTYLDLIEAAKLAKNQADWDAVNSFEFAQESRLFEIEQAELEARDALQADKRVAQRRLDFAILLGFALQQIGFVVVLLAGLLYQHRQRPLAAEPAPP
jgi:hypothetical protein